MELYIIRHGQTDYNKAGIIQGRKINAPINTTGRIQAKAFYNAYENEGFDHVITSALLRTKQTVEPFTNKGLVSNAFSEIDEIDWGIQEGMHSSPELKHTYKEILNEWKAGNLKKAMINGESPLDVQRRIKDFMKHVLSDLSGKVLICSHGRAMRVMFCTLLNVPLTEMDNFPHQNLSLYKLIRHNDSYQLEWENNTLHLSYLK